MLSIPEDYVIKMEVVEKKGKKRKLLISQIMHTLIYNIQSDSGVTNACAFVRSCVCAFCFERLNFTFSSK